MWVPLAPVSGWLAAATVVAAVVTDDMATVADDAAALTESMVAADNVTLATTAIETTGTDSAAAVTDDGAVAASTTAIPSSTRSYDHLVLPPLKPPQFGSPEENHHHHHVAPQQPHFADTNTSVEVFLSDTARLDCTVHDLTNESVSWMRQAGEVLELLTWDTHTYVNDHRYRVIHEAGDGWQRWQLVVSATTTQDHGRYRCKVATDPPLSLNVSLSVIEPVARVVDERGTKVVEKHYNSGSMIQLQCVIQSVPFPPAPVTWRRGPTTLSFNTSRGGISVKVHRAAGYIASRLYVTSAAPLDSGRYECWYGNLTHDAVTVHVIPGENSQAMQDDSRPGDTTDAGATGGDGGGRLPCWPLVSLALLVWLTCR